jgi:hypothetical protein
MGVLISTNSSLLWSLTFLSPVRDDLFVEINQKQKNEPHRGDLYLNVIKINSLLTLNKFSRTLMLSFVESAVLF